MHGLYVKLEWLVVAILVGLLYGSTSTLVAARRSQFLAASTVHMSLFAATVAAALTAGTPVPLELAAVVVGLVLLELYTLVLRRTRDPDAAASTIVSLTTGAAVLTIYALRTYMGYTGDVWAILVGDPLLADWRLIAAILPIAVAAMVALLYTYRDNIAIGIDGGEAVLYGINEALHNRLFNLVLVLTIVGLIRLTGFIMAHVLILLPGLIAARVSPSAGKALLYGSSVSVLSLLAGLYIGVLLDTPPVGVAGVILAAIYMAALSMKR